MVSSSFRTAVEALPFWMPRLSAARVKLPISATVRKMWRGSSLCISGPSHCSLKKEQWVHFSAIYHIQGAQ